MKTKLTQIVSYINTIDRHYTQVAFFVMMLAVSFVLRVPSDGGIGPS